MSMRLHLNTRSIYAFLLLCSVVFVIIYLMFLSNPKSFPKIPQAEYQYDNFKLTTTIETKTAVTLKDGINNSTKYILYWMPMWDSKTFFFGDEGYDLFRFCKFKNCYATHNKDLMPVERFHAIIFHAAQYNHIVHGVPKKRHLGQRYIFASMESPMRAYPENLDKYGYFYNWTMTYRRDSDIFRPYGYITKTPTNYTMPNTQTIKNKTGLVAWFVSNCRTINKREEIYKNLRRYVGIDVYGTCGKRKCPKVHHESSSKCYDKIEKIYKFYLSFENSHCKDYVTEKMFRVLERDMVPIVYGNGDYQKVAPPHSVIVADSFGNAKELADYLLYLDKNPEEYLKYFQWKRSYIVGRDFNHTVCKLCRMLNDDLEPRRAYEDILLWWLGNNYENCKVGDQLPNISKPFGNN